METGIHNTSEIGRLKKVLLHRPGKELENLMPEYLERLLFDDIPYLKEAQREHDAFADCLRGQGVAGKLVRAAVAKLKAQGLQAKTSCWYAAQWFERHPEEQGLLWKE